MLFNWLTDFDHSFWICCSICKGLKVLLKIFWFNLKEKIDKNETLTYVQKTVKLYVENHLS